MKKGLVIGILSGIGGVIVGAGGLVVYAIISAPPIASPRYDVTWKYDGGTRTIMKDYEITKDLSKHTDYDEATFKKFFPENEKKVSNSITRGEYTYEYKTVYKNAVNVANALETYDNVLGWESPKNIKIDPVTGNTEIADYHFGNKNDPWYETGKIPQDSAFMWYAGGPEGSHDLGQTSVASSVYSRFGRVFTFRQAQHGFVPRRTVILDYYGDTPEVQNAILTNDKTLIPANAKGNRKIWKEYEDSGNANSMLKKIENLELTNHDALPIIADMYNEDLPKLLLAYSMAITKVDADNTLAFRDAIGDKYPSIAKFYQGGISYGFTEAVNSALYGEDRLDGNKRANEKFDGIIASSNSIMPAQKGSLRLTGGMLTKENEDVFKGESGTVDPIFSLAIEAQKIVFGQKNALAKRLTDDTFKIYAENSMLFTANKNDWNIGDIIQEERDFYKDNNLKHNVDIDNNMGHNNIPWKEYAKFMGWKYQ